MQVLADGNRITRSVTTKMFRDNEGRFRREGTGGGASTIVAGGTYLPMLGFSDTISIYDPVEKVRYMLNPSSKTARRFGNLSSFTEGAVIVNGLPMSEAVKAQIETKPIAASKLDALNAQKAQVVVLGNAAAFSGAGKSESLGTKTFEGVEAEGTRTVTTISAGAIGNEKPIEIIYERWHSKELDLIVYSRHYDPRFGEQIYRLTNINRGEQDRSLFTVPSDYKMLEDSMFKVTTAKP
jgi:hypothetical protein